MSKDFLLSSNKTSLIAFIFLLHHQLLILENKPIRPNNLLEGAKGLFSKVG